MGVKRFQCIQGDLFVESRFVKLALHVDVRGRLFYDVKGTLLGASKICQWKWPKIVFMKQTYAFCLCTLSSYRIKIRLKIRYEVTCWQPFDTDI